MKNIDLAKKELKEKNGKLVVVKKGKVIFKSNKSGIVPMYELYNSKLEGIVSISDKFIGSGAAKLLLNTKLEVEELFAEIISESALEILKDSNIKISFDEKVEKILNRTGDDLCPVEKLSLNNEKFEEFYNKLFTFLKNTNQIQV